MPSPISSGWGLQWRASLDVCREYLRFKQPGYGIFWVFRFSYFKFMQYFYNWLLSHYWNEKENRWVTNISLFENNAETKCMVTTVPCPCQPCGSMLSIFLSHVSIKLSLYIFKNFNFLLKVVLAQRYSIGCFTDCIFWLFCKNIVIHLPRLSRVRPTLGTPHHI